MQHAFHVVLHLHTFGSNSWQPSTAVLWGTYKDYDRAEAGMLAAYHATKTYPGVEFIRVHEVTIQ